MLLRIMTLEPNNYPKYHLVAGIATFTGLPSVQIYPLDEEEKASVKAQLFLKFMDYGNPEPLVFTGDISEIRGKLREWSKQNGFKYSENETEKQLGFTVNVE